MVSFFLKDVYGVDFAGSVGMAIIRADDDVVLPAYLRTKGKSSSVWAVM
jgi:hypothetical protein